MGRSANVARSTRTATPLGPDGRRCPSQRVSVRSVRFQTIDVFGCSFWHCNQKGNEGSRGRDGKPQKGRPASELCREIAGDRGTEGGPNPGGAGSAALRQLEATRAERRGGEKR